MAHTGLGLPTEQALIGAADRPIVVADGQVSRKASAKAEVAVDVVEPEVIEVVRSDVGIGRPSGTKINPDIPPVDCS